jgi:membrane-associated protein
MDHVNVVLLTQALSIFGSLHDVAESAAEYGFLAVLLIVAGDGVFPVLPGETAIVAAAVLAAKGTGNILVVIAAGAIGAVIGDSAAYAIGRGGKGPIRRFVARFAGAERLEAAERMVHRNGPALIFTGRFLPGLRIAINMSCGATHMPYRRFLTFDAMGATVWSTQAALLGYFAGKAFADQTWVAFVVAFGVTGLVAVFVGVREKRYMRKLRAETDAVTTPTSIPARDEMS